MKFIKKIIHRIKKMCIYVPTTEEKLNKIIKRLSHEKQKLIELLPNEFKLYFVDNSFISGGCIYSLYHNQEPKDYDFFLKSDVIVDSLREYFTDASGYHGSKSSGGMFKNLGLIVTENAITIGKYQIITRWIGSPKEVVEQFDFKHNQFYFDEGKIQSVNGFEQLNSNESIYNSKRARDICGTIMRVNKFVQRGMKIKNKEMAKMLLRLHEVGFNERELEILNDSKSDQHFGSGS